MPRLSDLDEFYRLLDQLEVRIGGRRRLADCNGRMYWPQRGIYFFFETNEIRGKDPLCQRVTRVGTHALKKNSRTTLWNRLSQHRGSVNPRGGNHRGSIFRLLVGEAMINRNPTFAVESWGQGSSASREVRQAENPHEIRVSEYIGNMSFIFLPVLDDAGPNSARGVIERNIIALLSGFVHSRIDPPNPDWLGTASSRDRVRRSGLWNNNHVGDDYDRRFLGLFEALVHEASMG